MRRLAPHPTPSVPLDERSATVDPAAEVTFKQRVLAYVALTKPRIIELLLITTVPAMIVARADCRRFRS